MHAWHAASGSVSFAEHAVLAHCVAHLVQRHCCHLSTAACMTVAPAGDFASQHCSQASFDVVAPQAPAPPSPDATPGGVVVGVGVVAEAAGTGVPDVGGTMVGVVLAPLPPPGAGAGSLLHASAKVIVESVIVIRAKCMGCLLAGGAPTTHSGATRGPTCCAEATARNRESVRPKGSRWG